MYFMIDASILTSVYTYYSYKFYKDPTNQTAMKSFKWSLYFLPIFLSLMLIHLNLNKEEDDDEKELEILEKLSLDQ